MKKRRKREKRRKTDKKVIAFVIIAALLIIVVVYQVIKEISRSKPKYSAEEYFDIMEPIPFGGLSEDGSHLFLYSLTFTIKAVGGDAHEVIANSGGLGFVEPTWVGTILKDEESTVFLVFQPEFPVSLPLKGEEFSITLQIASVEASGFVTIYFPPPET